MAEPQLLRPLNETPTPALPKRDIDFKMLQFRFEVLGEALPTLARENSLNLTMLETLAQEQGWEVLTVSDQDQEDRLQEVVAAANLRLQALKAFREIDKFQSMARLEDAAINAASRSLQDPNLSPGQIQNLSQVIKTIRYGQADSATPVKPNAVRASIDITSD